MVSIADCIVLYKTSSVVSVLLFLAHYPCTVSKKQGLKMEGECHGQIRRGIF